MLMESDYLSGTLYCFLSFFFAAIWTKWPHILKKEKRIHFFLFNKGVRVMAFNATSTIFQSYRGGQFYW